MRQAVLRKLVIGVCLGLALGTLFAGITSYFRPLLVSLPISETRCAALVAFDSRIRLFYVRSPTPRVRLRLSDAPGIVGVWAGNPDAIGPTSGPSEPPDVQQWGPYPWTDEIIRLGSREDIARSGSPWYGPIRSTNRTLHPGVSGWYIRSPFWLPAVLFVVPLVPILLRGLRRRHRLRRGLCEKCGYDLTGNISGVCPECGAAASWDETQGLT
jgi:hypothetical protein